MFPCVEVQDMVSSGPPLRKLRNPPSLAEVIGNQLVPNMCEICLLLFAHHVNIQLSP